MRRQPTAAIPMENPYCSCELTVIVNRCAGKLKKAPHLLVLAAGPRLAAKAIATLISPRPGAWPPNLRFGAPAALLPPAHRCPVFAVSDHAGQSPQRPGAGQVGVVAYSCNPYGEPLLQL